jgi:hypothetical protein
MLWVVLFALFTLLCLFTFAEIKVSYIVRCFEKFEVKVKIIKQLSHIQKNSEND